MTDPDKVRLRWVEHEADVYETAEDTDGPDTIDWEDR